MTSLRRASSPNSASAGGQELHPCEVNSSTTTGVRGEGESAKPGAPANDTTTISTHTQRPFVFARRTKSTHRVAKEMSDFRSGPDASAATPSTSIGAPSRLTQNVG